MIVITAGHSNSDPGAVGQGTTEAKVVAEFRNLVAKELSYLDVPYVTDGEGENNLPLSSAIKLAKAGTVAVEFHCNAADASSATGVETLSADKDKAFGAALCAAIANATGIRNRGAKSEGSGQHSRLGFVQAGGVILELFFISNPSDYQAFIVKQSEAARTVAAAIASEYNRRK